MHFEHIPASDHVASGEVFRHDSARRSHLFGVELNQISGLSNGPKTGLSPRPGTATHFSATNAYGRRRFQQQRPVQPQLVVSAQLAPKARELSRALGILLLRICMATLYRVSPIILNEDRHGHPAG